MDVRKTGYFGQMQISGVAKPINDEGSIIGMVSQFLRDLQELNPRSLKDGKEIIIILRDRPLQAVKSESQLQRVNEVEAQLDLSTITDEIVPGNNESYFEFIKRLENSGLDNQSAIYIANDWYGIENDTTSRLAQWQNDHKAIRFRQLNSSHKEFESAMPTEYAELKQYVLREYPEFCERITFRVA